MGSDLEAPAALAGGEAVLLIADAALMAHRDRIAPHSLDLGELWQQRTGLPMVFAVWAAREDAAVTRPAALDALCDAIASGSGAFAADPEGVARAAAQRFPFDEAYIRGYLGRLRYGFGDAERAGLEAFLDMARAAGELHEVPALRAVAA